MAFAGKMGGERDIREMNPFDWKNNPFWLCTLPGFIAAFFVIGVSLRHSLLSGVISIAVILLLIFLYIKRNTKKAKGEAKEK